MINERMLSLGNSRSSIRELFEYGKKLKAQIGEENVFDFSLGNPSIPTPDRVTERLKELLADTPAVELHGYTSAEGALWVREAIAKHITDKHSHKASADYIYMTAGAAAALTCSLGAICQPADEVIVLAPYFPEYRVFIEGVGAKVVEVCCAPADFHPDLKLIEASISERTAAIIINSPNNPTGAVYTEEEILSICDLLNRKSLEYGHPIYILSDEPYRELVYGTGEPPFIPKFYSNTIVCYSYSKSLSLPGERIGYVFVNPEAEDSYLLFRAVCGAGRSFGYVCAPSLLQMLVGSCQGLTSDVSKYKENRDILCHALSEYGYSFTKPEGAFYLFIKAPEGCEHDFFSEAKARGILLVPSDSFGITGYFRLSYCVDRDMIIRSLPKFKELILCFKKG